MVQIVVRLTKYEIERIDKLSRSLKISRNEALRLIVNEWLGLQE